MNVFLCILRRSNASDIMISCKYNIKQNIKENKNNSSGKNKSKKTNQACKLMVDWCNIKIEHGFRVFHSSERAFVLLFSTNFVDESFFLSILFISYRFLLLFTIRTLIRVSQPNCVHTFETNKQYVHSYYTHLFGLNMFNVNIVSVPNDHQFTFGSNFSLSTLFGFGCLRHASIPMPIRFHLSLQFHVWWSLSFVRIGVNVTLVTPLTFNLSIFTDAFYYFPIKFIIENFWSWIWAWFAKVDGQKL